LKQQPTTFVVSVVCTTCGTSHLVRSTTPSMSVDVCSSCHPAYTGEQRSVTTGSRIERFNRRRELAAAL